MSDQQLTHPSVAPVAKGGPLGVIVRFDFKPGWQEEAKKRGFVGFIETMKQEPTFVNFFRLHDQTNPNRMVIYETWNCSREYFLDVEMKRSYRNLYEEILPGLVSKPREMQLYWRLIRSQSQTLDPIKDDRTKFGFFVHFQVRPGKEGKFRALLDPLLDTMSAEASFLNYFLLQHENDPNRFVIYETWLGTADHFLKNEMPRPYRQGYEAAVPGLLTKPRDVERNWNLLYAADRGSSYNGTPTSTIFSGSR